MVSYLRICLQDGDGRTGFANLPVEDVALPAGYQAKIDAVTAVMGGQSTAFLTEATVRYTEVCIRSAINETLPARGDIRDNWITQAQAALTPGSRPFTFQIPGRNTNPVLTLASSKNTLIDPTQPAWTSFVAALLAAGVGLVDPELDDAALLLGARADTSKRRAPRI